MQGNQNLNQSTNYARLPDDQSPYFNQPQPVIIDDSQPHYGQPIHYNPGFNQNQGFNNQGFNNQGFNNQGFNNQGFINQGYQYQGFDNNTNNVLMMKYASQLRCLALTAIIQNIIYILFDIIYYGFTVNGIFFLMILEIIGFSFYLSKIKNNMVTEDYFSRTRKIFIATCIGYTIYFVIIIIIVVAVINNADPDVDPTAVIVVLIVSSLIFLLPRYIALCVVGRKGPRPVLIVGNQ